MACNHKFVAHNTNVVCEICGLSMTGDEYREFIAPKREKPQTEKKSTTQKKTAKTAK